MEMAIRLFQRDRLQAYYEPSSEYLDQYYDAESVNKTDWIM